MRNWIEKFRSRGEALSLHIDGCAPLPIRRDETAEMRVLSAEELVLLRRLLEKFHHEAFLDQLQSARVTGGCSCGCPTIYLEVPKEVAVQEAPARSILVDATGQAIEGMVGILLFQARGRLSCLEVYDLSGSDGTFGLPLPESVEQIEPL